jgi:serine/threonine protein phosphatase PrpC
MSSSDTVALICALMKNMTEDDNYDSMDRDSIVTHVVEEALRRGSNDNITVIIVWLK